MSASTEAGNGRRRGTWLALVAAAAALAAAAAVGGCKQREGERCQLDSDCVQNADVVLICRHPERENVLCTQDPGCQCLPPSMSDAGPGTDAASTDAAPGTDAAATDAVPGTDSAPGTDAACDGGPGGAC